MLLARLVMLASVFLRPAVAHKLMRLKALTLPRTHWVAALRERRWFFRTNKSCSSAWWFASNNRGGRICLIRPLFLDYDRNSVVDCPNSGKLARSGSCHSLVPFSGGETRG